MPRYFFHAADGEPIPDHHGSDYESDADARNEALRYAGQILNWKPERLLQTNQSRVEVRDDVGAVLFTVITLLIDVPERQRRITNSPANDLETNHG